MPWSATRTTAATTTTTSTAAWARCGSSTRTGACRATSSSSAATPSGSSGRASPGKRARNAPFAVLSLSPADLRLTRPATAGVFICACAEAAAQPGPGASEKRDRILGLALAGHQPLQPLGGGDFAAQHVAHRAGDRQLDAVAVGQPHHLIGGLQRLDHLADLTHRLLDRLAAPKRQPQPPVARK